MLADRDPQPSPAQCLPVPGCASSKFALRPGDVNPAAHTVRVLHGKENKATTRGFHPTAAEPLARWINIRRRLGIRSRILFCTRPAAR